MTVSDRIGDALRERVERPIRRRLGLTAGRHLMAPAVLSYCVLCGVSEIAIKDGKADWCPAPPDDEED